MSSASMPHIRKLILSAVGLVWLISSGMSFYKSRRLEEPVVLSEGVTEVKKLSEYHDGVRGTANDCNVYILEGEEEGGTIFVMGGSHPEEPAGRLAAWLFAENAVMERGRLILVLSSNRSASTVTRIGGAYPPDFSIQPIGVNGNSDWAIVGQTRSTSGPTRKFTSTIPASRISPSWISET